MKYSEVSPLPEVCQDCKEQECYNCDYAGLRWVLPPEEEARISRHMRKRAADRLLRRTNFKVVITNTDREDTE